MKLKSVFFFVLVAVLQLALMSQLEAADKPNIIIILADDLGYGDVGCFGNKQIKTPNIDALAADGIRFTDFHSNGTVCSPTRAALLTGRYQQRTGISGVVTAAGHRDTGLDLQEMTFAEIVKTVGYTTAIFGKWHLGYQPDFNPVHQGFDEFNGYVSGNVDYHIHVDQTGREDWWKQDKLTPQKGYSTDLITDYGVEFIQRNKNKQFLLYLAHETPHYPYQRREDPPVYVPDKGKPKDRSKRQPHNIYRKMIETMDEGIGRIRKTVIDEGLSNKTLIIFFSDNGPAGPGSAGPLKGRKGQIWEGGHRVPAVACWPGTLKAGKVSTELIMGADILPTIAAVSGASIPEGLKLDGINLLPHLTKSETLPSRPVFWGYNNSLAIRMGDYKLVTDKKFSKTSLYNLKNDLKETTDISKEHPETAQKLLNLLRVWHKEVNEGVKKRS